MTKTHLETKRVIDRVWMQSKKIQLDVSTIRKHCNGPTDQHIIKAARIGHAQNYDSKGVFVA